MAERELAFSTFLKLLELEESKKATTLRGFNRGGGFNYWRPLQKLAPEVVGGKLGLKELQEKVGLFAKGHQRKYNDHALTNLSKWVSRREITARPLPGKVIKKFGSSGLAIRLEPEVAFAMDGRDYLMHIWATNNPTLTEETLSMGLHFFRLHFQSEGYKNHQFLIFDTVKNHVFAEFNIFGNAPLKLKGEREMLNKLWAEIDDKNKTPKPKDIFPDQPSPPF